MTKEESWLRDGLAGIVLLHFAVALWHGTAHAHVPVPLTFLQRVFIAVVIILFPLAGAALLWTRRRHVGASLIAASMAASLLFGFVNHFMIESPDYVMSVPAHAWRPTFIFSAALLVLTETIGAIMAAVGVRTWRRP